LRRAGIEAPILVLGYAAPGGLATAAELGITLTAFNREGLDEIARLGVREDGRRLRIHVKLDTGMGRIGIRDPQEAVDYIERAMRMPHVSVEGLYTHYACADEADKTYTLEQYNRIAGIVGHFRAKGIEFPYVHAGNSATAIDCPELTFNMVRIGISLYGYYPSDEVKRERIELRPLLSFKTSIVMLKRVPANTAVSYGAIYRTPGEAVIATLPVGYADGFSRMLTGKAEVLVRGKRAPVVGRICMDQCMIDVTGIPDAALGDEAVLIGRQGNECITADDWANVLGTISYEVLCMVSSRVPRMYTTDRGQMYQ